MKIGEDIRLYKILNFLNVQYLPVARRRSKRAVFIPIPSAAINSLSRFTLHQPVVPPTRPRVICTYAGCSRPCDRWIQPIPYLQMSNCPYALPPRITYVSRCLRVVAKVSNREASFVSNYRSNSLLVFVHVSQRIWIWREVFVLRLRIMQREIFLGNIFFEDLSFVEFKKLEIFLFECQ